MEEAFETWDSFVGYVKAQNGKEIAFSSDSFDRFALERYKDFASKSDPVHMRYIIQLEDGDCIRIQKHERVYKVWWDDSCVNKIMIAHKINRDRSVISYAGALPLNPRLAKSMMSI